MHYCLKSIFALFLFLFLSALQAADSPSTHSPSPHKTICLNMIVKNEKDVIQRCLSSTLPLIDYWVIVDTGSTDGTEQIIKDFMKEKGVPGELHTCPWVNFAHNRNEALNLAKGKGDYLFFIDADEYLTYDVTFEHPQLDKDYYYVNTLSSGTNYGRILCINNHLDWKWKGVLHEIIDSLSSRTGATLEKISNIVTQDGARSRDPLKYQKDAAILEAALKDEPDNCRYVFYLGQTYFAMQNYALALQNYEKRVSMGGFDQEVFYSLLQIGRLKEALQMADEAIIASYKRAFQYRPTRAEPLYQLARYLRQKNKYAAGYDTAKSGLMMPLSNDVLFVDSWVYDYGLLLEFSVCAYWTGHYDECQAVCVRLLKKPNLPVDFRSVAEKNLALANSRLLEQACKNM